MRSFYEQANTTLALCRRHQRPASLAYIDLDNFKIANDRFGHKQGDMLLREVAQLLDSYLRKSDISARIGGDEFVIFLPETDPDGVFNALERFRAHLSQSPQFQVCSVTASIGVVSYWRSPDSIYELINAADDLMYTVKSSTKNRVYLQVIKPEIGEA
ncbi:MAG: GGDEF domain-containing protein [Oscillatoriales cyanobacterium RM2_1_1]|nr:GGDEF domain-containing protein [Oscillatoriales cyanobacterium RM2_1_1]